MLAYMDQIRYNRWRSLLKAREEWVCLVALGRSFHSHALLAANDLRPHSVWFVKMGSFSAPRVLLYPISLSFPNREEKWHLTVTCRIVEETLGLSLSKYTPSMLFKSIQLNSVCSTITACITSILHAASYRHLGAIGHREIFGR